ncbi:unnamed protein product [Parascedosporium putredinis]|uniref:SET domain-containing protein n=1 Tax=Parascedosporium putredinis TaxID=1442378 RepID=A0A9P1H7Q4_9PEZI|nr:unnamed protein product [Parascedosporium putredinis]CAI7998881.1 unnamed protein product [Parascedosporium putredinis]
MLSRRQRQALIAATNAISIPHVKELPHKVEAVEEEPYTIKCICNFPDDDGNTIFCETCETWQHIDCFYPDNREEALRETFSHYCHQCKPRPLDHKRAIERTQNLRKAILEEEETHDKKPKRPASKSHKKKPKPNDLLLNGTNNGQDGITHQNPVDVHHPPAKKPKISHRPSHSISSQPSKKSPSYGQAKPLVNGHHQQQPSPANTPPDLPMDFELHNYSANFFSLHSEDDVQIVQNNSFATLNISNTMSLWLHDHDRKQALRVEQKSYSPTPEKKLRLQYLTTPSAIEKEVPLMELNGMIGFQNDYCADPESYWPELTSPLPFVFFHPLLPLYIDTRKEGSEARYVRRSCKPNAVLDTYLSGSGSGGSEYHFWLVSDRDITAKEQITLAWDFRFRNEEKARWLHRLGLGDDETDGSEYPEMDDAEYETISSWLHRLLSEYGGCACDLGSNCAFARFHRHYLGRTQARANSKKKRKAKTQNVSPTSTGYATNSRAASEGHVEDGLEHDAQSTSSRSKPPSRDRTPFQQNGTFDQLGILTEPTDRDKRKFDKIKVISDTGKHDTQSREWQLCGCKHVSEQRSHPQPEATPKSHLSSQRLLNNRHRQKVDEVDRRKSDVAQTETTAMDIDSPGTDHHSTSSSPVMMKDTVSTTATSPAPTPADIAMIDASSVSPSTLPAQVIPEGIEPTVIGIVKIRTPDLKVQMPPVPTFTNAINGPLTSSVSPFGPSGVNGVQPSPVKKKLSFSDYRKSRMDKDKATVKPPGSATQSIPEESKPTTTLPHLNGDSSTVDQPIRDVD